MIVRIMYFVAQHLMPSPHGTHSSSGKSTAGKCAQSKCSGKEYSVVVIVGFYVFFANFSLIFLKYLKSNQLFCQNNFVYF